MVQHPTWIPKLKKIAPLVDVLDEGAVSELRQNSFIGLFLLAMVLLPHPHSDKPGLMIIEGGLTLVAAAIAFGWPEFGSSIFQRLERLFGRLAQRRRLAVAVVGLSDFLLRLAILPWCPVPHPFVPDDFSFLLAADTFASGRLTNPTPAMWRHFETIHISMRPTYMSMYFPGEGLVLAAGKVLTGHPWYGILSVSALMCAAICWMLQAWLPPSWALLGGFLAVLRIGLFSCWVNSYHTAGSIAALGGALVLGAVPRLRKHPQLRYAMLLALGAGLLAISRPYEGLLLCLPVAAALGHWLWARKNRPPAGALLRLSAAPVALIFTLGAWMGYYDYRAFGSPFTPPYVVDRETYATAPYFVWQSPRPEPAYRHVVMRRFYEENELAAWKRIQTGFLPQTLMKAAAGILFFSGIALLPPLLMLHRVLRDRRVRFLIVCLAVLSAGMAVQIFIVAHYLSPFTAAFYALGLQAMRHLRLMRFDGRPVGLGWVRLTVTICLVLGGVRLFASPLHLQIPQWPASEWNSQWYGPIEFGKERARVAATLERLPGKQLVIVRYSADHNPLDEWVYNAPDIDRSKVIWAREMDAADNLELILYYRERNVWLIEPDTRPVEVVPYPDSRALKCAGQKSPSTPALNYHANRAALAPTSAAVAPLAQAP